MRSCLSVVAVLVTACDSNSAPANDASAGNNAAFRTDSSTATDALTSDTTSSEGAAANSGDAAAAHDADSAAVDAGVCNHEITNPACWTSFDSSGLTNLVAQLERGAFDGRYLYVNNTSNGFSSDTVLRHDTQAALTASWTHFNTSTFGADFLTSSGFDGHYVYFTQQVYAAPMAGGTAMICRVDTRTAFNARTSWSTFSLVYNPPNDGGVADSGVLEGGVAIGDVPNFVGIVFDGQYLYFVPSDKVVARYDTRADFQASASWSMFDTATLQPSASTFEGGAFDGRYVYFSPATSGLVTRYDTMGNFGTTASWSSFDTKALNGSASGFSGAVFDGRYVYFVPARGTANHAIIVRVDTTGNFAQAAAWSVFDPGPIQSSTLHVSQFQGATFDGRYVYFVPEFNSDPFLRFDSQGNFTDATAWVSADMLTVAPSSNGFTGALFDGQYVYFIPRGYGAMARYDAKSPPALPQRYNASFY